MTPPLSANMAHGIGENPEAFPCVGYGLSGDSYMQPGMTLRDYFAAQVIPSIVSATSAGQHNPSKMKLGISLIEEMALDAYEIADALLIARALPAVNSHDQMLSALKKLRKVLHDGILNSDGADVKDALQTMVAAIQLAEGR